MTVRKVTGGLNLFATVRSDSITTGGFTVDLSGGDGCGDVHNSIILAHAGMSLRSGRICDDDANGVEKSVADWGLCGLTRERINQMPDMVTFRAEATPSDADPIFAHGSTVRLFQNGTPWFYGRVVQVPGRASAKAEEQLYRLAGPWWYLENLVFQQTWQTTNGTDIDAGPDEQEPADPGPEIGRDEAGDGRGDPGGAGLRDGAGRADHGGRR